MNGNDSDLERWMDAHPGSRTFKDPCDWRGYADIPGPGPSNETCGTCAQHVIKCMGKHYYKCALMERFWAASAVTDIRVRSMACRHWEGGGAQHVMPPR